MVQKENKLLVESFNYALYVIDLYKFITDDKREYVMSKQLLRAGTSVGANIREAQNAQSIKDFIHKLYIAQKECDESLYWMELLVKSKYLTREQIKDVYHKGKDILKMLRSAIITSKQRYNLK